MRGSGHKGDAGNSLRRPTLEIATEEERQNQLKCSQMYLARLRHYTTMSFTSEFGSFCECRVNRLGLLEGVKYDGR